MTSTTIAQRAWVEQIMGLPISVHLRGDDLTGESVERQVVAVFAELRRVDTVLSPYRDDSDLSRWERRELRLADADPMLATVMALCDEAQERTGGWFDARGLPDPRTGESRYDPSGLVKGWAVERAAGHLAELDGLGWCVNAGGDVLLHAPADQPAWRGGIEKPDDPARLIGGVARRRGAGGPPRSAPRGAPHLDPPTCPPPAPAPTLT